MKATIEFELPDDQEEFELAVSSNRYYSVIIGLDNHLRSKIKYAADDISDEKLETYEEIRDFLRNLCSENEINPFK